MASKREAQFGVLLRHWLRANPIPTCALELKQTASDSLPFGAVESHQLDYAEAISTSDTGVLIRVQGVNGEPDYLWLRKEPAYMVIRYPNCFALIAIKTFIVEKNLSVRRSLTSKRAKEISTFYVEL